ncbi:Ubiquinone/menaquinone biosynthesis C-methylase UbiE [Enhydrobacter aerosaccus]|uniref:Ubiquinone/menaquinone biosynthesis C-methylase UbiE n=1 Tax=Enhydrobacter aerosaccus TaxID=225324 RepID=A0A1T4PM02_9HYPH|nr:class I SAM-dependent methyltransferase [Enhydrobacter aerosaccus]SJZ92522.1 Ubiquinone/menaquinone biosynthesis C-methylase UbiE [Enhydrobacter aerosaccus]
MKTQAELAAEQASFWNGPGGEGWLASYQRIQQTVASFGDAVLTAAAAKPGESVLDVGCGTGETSAVLARAVQPGGRVLGVDISEVLVAAARQQAPANATFVVGDAATQAFEAASIDLIFSRFGVMFFADPVAAFRNLHRALKPGGRLVFICWRTPQENPWGLVPLRAAAPFLPPFERPGPEEPGQYAFGDRAHVERILTAAGFGTPRFEAIDRPVLLGRDVAAVLDSLVRFGPLSRLLAEAAPDARDKALKAVAEVLKPHESPDGIRLPGACWLVTAGFH